MRVSWIVQSYAVFLALNIQSRVSNAGPLDEIEKPKETDNSTPTPNPNPTPTPIPNPIPNDIPAPVPQQAGGVLVFGARLVSNMENGFHIMEHGYKAVCVDSQGVVAQARMDIYAAVNGEVADSTGSSGYTPVTLRPALEYLRAGATTGSCEFKVCLPKADTTPGTDITCDERVNKGIFGVDKERPVTLHLQGVPYSVAGKDIDIKTNFPLVSAFHPVFGFAAPGKAFNDFQSPLVINFSKSEKLDLVDVWDSKRDIKFDMIADGAAVRTGWIGKQAGFLALDLNGNGKIDNGLELFGEYSQGAKPRDDGRRWDNGFLALAQFDLNRDGQIDEKDEIFGRLVVWQDKNLDGKSQKSELLSLKKSHVKTISLAYGDASANGKPVKVEGNEVRLVSSITLDNGEKRTVSDVWFRQSKG
ncbi:MAG: hypothetical protein NTV34_07340 [Proteobacteria bacterium]|nr:hypothetical protein [Pseudomonadota bacterium]